jgi:hypothetical protein
MALAEQPSLPESIWRQQCRKCGKVKIVSLDTTISEFTIEKRTGKPRGECKRCNADRRRAYVERLRRENPRKFAELKRRNVQTSRRWQRENPERVQANKERWRERHPERYREIHDRGHRKWLEKVQNDPEKRQQHLEDRRIRYRLNRELETGSLKVANRGSEQFRERHTRVSTEPFMRWLLPVMKGNGYTAVSVARMAGIDSSGLERIVYGRYKFMDISTADKVLTALGGPPLASLYPEA